MALTRRLALQAALAVPVAAGAAPAPFSAAPAPFSAAMVRAQARELAAAAYQAPDTAMPVSADALTYEQYRGIAFRQERALWRGQDLPFQVAFYPRGFLYRRGVAVFEVADGQAAPIAYSAGLFQSADPAVQVPEGLGFAGFRVHAPINRAGEFEEFCVFLGASYFRAVGRGGQYGLSARGLAIGTGRAEPEEFPDFRVFWLERPQQGATALVIHALLDSPSVTGAFRFTLRPGESTLIDVESTLFPRRDIPDWGVAPLTSMYVFSPRDRARPGLPEDWRTAVHDSDGLAVLTGRNERLWRPLANPAGLQFSAFADTDPRGFGLLQRRRGFQDYGDLQVLYGRRPSLWIEPLGGWGAGAVDLVEIPTDTEYNDNMVAFWRGRETLRAGAEYGFAYRQHWGASAPTNPALARIERMRTGAGRGTRVFVLDLAGGSLRGLPETAKTRLELGSSAGRLTEGYSGPNPETGGWRISLEFDPAGARLADLRCALLGEHGALAETWLYRWAA